jgi:hypothetical protein
VSAYGYDSRRRQRARPLTLGQKCAAWVLVYAVLWAAGALVLAVLVPTGKNLDFPTPPAQGRTTDVTTTLSPTHGGDHQ